MKLLKEFARINNIGLNIQNQQNIGYKPNAGLKGTGEPSKSASDMAATLQQTIMSQDDIDYWAGTDEEEGATFNPPYNIKHHYRDYTQPESVENIGININEYDNNDVLKWYIKYAIDEASVMAGGAIAGFTLPLGMASPGKKKYKKQYQPTMDAFGRGKEVG